MSITLGELNSSQNFLLRLMDLELPIAIAYRLNNLIKTVAPPLEFYQKEWKKIVDKYALRDEAGHYKYNDLNLSVLIQPDKIEECNKAFQALDQIESDIDVHLLTLEDFTQLEAAGLKITPREIRFYEMFKV